MTIPILILLLLLYISKCFAQENNNNPTSKCLVPTPTTGFCSYPLCDTCTALPFDSVSIKQDLGINYGKYYNSSRYELYLDCDAGHGLQNGQPPALPYKADYGTGYPTPDLVSTYIVGRAATFFQTIIGGANQTTHKVFVECRNNRVTCTQGNNDAGCMNTDDCSTHPH